ncbi:hypothetical protein PSMK_02160 [Phycisphaera mikurensis NBRC 102666]|uniref:DUF4157 domain-containing protein n=1 Tax=Phycisphaera mikurensis (strain NBRC 102666 / KCTC 22515 / FYK2301M01) TaxID=1142394 RepID=I0IAT7_PHYMF|nr:hypothetical protein PSMK_02160 [Phycisphaera mikurensis NBRC 102666]
MIRVVRSCWCFPSTLPGLAVAVLNPLFGGTTAAHTGVVESHGGLAAWLLRHATLLRGGALAITLGEVVLGRTAAALDLTRAHERVHVAQARRWGPLFYPAYGLATVAAWRRGACPYRGNRFEVEAHAAA